ncbi:MAG TPA: 5-formyltetrahydrofolate cyclo-ligase [Clostridiaceae bacterium]|nr:5-formyltetrahydrofolate cyclo-ligase [Clostridiaceae bacterium]
MKEEKRLIRKRILEIRETADIGFIHEMSLRITKKFTSMDIFKKSETIMAYMDFRNEVATMDLIKFCISHKKRVALPRIESRETGHKEIYPYVIHDILLDTEPGFYGIMEPVRNPGNLVRPDEIDIVLVPGVAFSEGRYRIGYGAGYYDRFLKKVRTDCIKIGIAFEFQVLKSIPVEEHDVPLDMIITEERIIL